MKKRLTEISVQRMSPDPSKRLEIYDELSPGLMLRITPSGKKSWSMMYRVAGAGVDGKRGNLKRYTLGAYPFLDLKAARAAHREAVELVDKGIDPDERRRSDNEARFQRTYNLVLDRFIQLHAKPNTKNWRNTKLLLERPFAYSWEQRDINEIKRADVHELIDRIIKDRGENYASELRRKLTKFFNWSVDRGLLAASPMAGMRRPELAYVPRERVLELDELRAIWRVAEEIKYPFGPIVQLLILTGQRRSEIAKLQRSWLSEDMQSFEIPASLYKTKRSHVVPLPSLAASIVSSQPIWNRGDYLFSTTGGKTPVSGFSKAKARIDNLSGITDWTLHDIRRSVATHLARLSVSQEHIERVLGHTVEGVAGTYNRYSYFDEKFSAIGMWEKNLL